VKRLLAQAISSFVSIHALESMHAAALQPGRLAAWLEGAEKLPVPECVRLMRTVESFVSYQRLAVAGGSEGLPGVASAAQWREGAVQLRQEVSNWL
jgi:hypothetical protein